MTHWRWLNQNSLDFLQRGYLLEDQTVEDRVKIIGDTAEKILKVKGYSDKFQEYFSYGWFSLSTPIWANFGTNRGLPISCFGSCIDDSMESILETQAEVGMMTKYGGGTSGYFGNLRGRGTPISNNGESFGSVHFMRLFENIVNVVSQGSTRRGSFAAYLDIDHADIKEFLSIRSEGHPLQDIYTGVSISDDWLNAMIDGDGDKREVWAKVLESRINTGFPYLFFRDNVNNNKPQPYKDNNIDIKHGNLCSEICLSNNSDESFVCDLSSMNILYYDEWKDTDAVETVIYLLDAVMTEFIKKTKNIPFLNRARNFAIKQRALGLGWLGYHSYLQSKMIPFESMEAKYANVEIAKKIQTSAQMASQKMAQDYGVPTLMRGYEQRHITLTAIAPTKSSSFILGQVSEGIEPHRANYYIKDLQKGKFTVKNIHLENILENKGKNTQETWQSILINAGSVQHLDCLSEKEKSVFKTFMEISPKEIVIQASQRQKYIDQSQSLNLIIDPSTNLKEINQLYLDAWKLGIKTFYYQISVNAAQNLSRKINQCESCGS